MRPDGTLDSSSDFAPSAHARDRVGLVADWLGAARSSLLIARDPTDPESDQRILAQHKSNFGRLAVSRLLESAGMSGGRYGHAAVAIGNTGYVYGGYNAYTTCEAFTPPNFGTAPDAPTSIGQTGSRDESALQAKPDLSSFDGWTNQQVLFTANVTDPNEGQQVRMRVQIKPESAAWTSAAAIVSLDSGLTAQGEITIPWTIPSGGGYDWRYRIEDEFQNSHPDALANTPEGWIEAFGTEGAPNASSPDFRSDQESPAEPV